MTVLTNSTKQPLCFWRGTLHALMNVAYGWLHGIPHPLPPSQNKKADTRLGLTKDHLIFSIFCGKGKSKVQKLVKAGVSPSTISLPYAGWATLPWTWAILLACPWLALQLGATNYLPKWSNLFPVGLSSIGWFRKLNLKQSCFPVTIFNIPAASFHYWKNESPLPTGL